MKHLRTLALGAALTLGLAQAATAAPVSIALDGPPDLARSGSYVWVHAFAEALKADGMAVRELPRGAVGGESEKLDQVSTGLLDISLSDVKSVGKMDPLIYGVRLPYIFDDVAQMDRVLAKGHVFEKINKKIASSDVMLLALVPIGPPSGIITTKAEVHSPADMKNLRMRALDDAQIALYKAWGSTGTIVAWKEVPAALQTGVVDGYLNTAFVPLVFGQTDIVKHFTDAKVIIAQRAIIASKGWYDGLSAKQKADVNAAVAKANAVNRAWLKKVGKSSLDDLRKAGVTVVVPTPQQLQAFRTLSEKTYDSGLMPKQDVAFWTKLAKETR